MAQGDDTATMLEAIAELVDEVGFPLGYPLAAHRLRVLAADWPRIALERVAKMLRSWPFPLVVDAPIAAAGMILRPDRLSVTVDDRTVALTPLQISLLAALMRAYPRFATHAEIISGTWGVSRDLVTRRNLRAAVCRLRARIGRRRIGTRHGGLLHGGAYRLSEGAPNAL